MKYTNKIFKTKKEYVVTKNITIPKGGEIQIMRDVVYMGGFPVPQETQNVLLKWVIDNEKELLDDTNFFK